MSKPNAATLNALRTLFGARAASRLFRHSQGRGRRQLLWPAALTRSICYRSQTRCLT
jgi:hypothetical protein